MKTNKQGVRDLSSFGTNKYNTPKLNNKHRPPLNQYGMCMNQRCRECFQEYVSQKMNGELD